MLKTSRKICYSFDLGKFPLITSYDFCQTHKYYSIESKRIIKYQSDLVTLIVDKGHQVTFDLVVKVGRLRYDDHRQLEEIQSFLSCSSAKLALPVSTIGMIAKRYLGFCKRLHEKYEDKILEDIQANGGYILHFDGTTEVRAGQSNFVLRDGLTGHVLISEMIQSENSESVRELLAEVLFKYGEPLAILSDLKPGFVGMCREVFGDDIIHILCHYHFLRTFKEDFYEDHNFIRTHLTQTCKLRSGIQDQLKFLNLRGFVTCSSDKTCKTLDQIKVYWIQSEDLPNTYRQVLQWILHFKQDSSGKGVPFDLPYLDFYQRFRMGKRLIDEIFSDKSKSDPGTRLTYYYNGFQKIIKKMGTAEQKNPEFKSVVRRLEFKRKWFIRLRGTLFMETKQKKRDALSPLSTRYQLTESEAKIIPENIKKYLNDLKKQIAASTNKEKKEILTRFKKQTEKYEDHLKIPILTLTVNGEIKTFIFPRTNNFLESFFRLIKSLIRRQTGRSKLPREFVSVGHLLPFYQSMREHKTFKAIFENEKRLAEEFAQLSAQDYTVPDNVIGIPIKLSCPVDSIADFAALEA
jgi:hypothetical protein